MWVSLYSFLEVVSTPIESDYIIYESPGDPIQNIYSLKSQILTHLQDRLVFILSGDQRGHIDDDCLWYTCAVAPTGLARHQKQIFVTNPAIFRFRNPQTPEIRTTRHIPIYFKGSIWPGMRTEMQASLNPRPGVVIEDFTTYWDWRFAEPRSDREIEEKAFDLYKTLLHCKLSLCPKGKGNSSMRIVESIACGAVPVLIDDFSAPFGYDYSRFCLVFDTKTHSWDQIYQGCIQLLHDPELLAEFQRRGEAFYRNVVCVDFHLPQTGYTDYTDVNTVAYGFSSFIVSDLWQKWLARQSHQRSAI